MLPCLSWLLTRVRFDKSSLYYCCCCCALELPSRESVVRVYSPLSRARLGVHLHTYIFSLSLEMMMCGWAYIYVYINVVYLLQRVLVYLSAVPCDLIRIILPLCHASLWSLSHHTQAHTREYMCYTRNA